MLEHTSESLLPRAQFILRLTKNLIFVTILITIALYIGMIGYHAYEHMSWVDAFANASMILAGMGPLTPLNTDAGKMFAGFYALFSGLFFIVIMGIILAPIIHRIFHKAHLAKADDVIKKIP